MFVKICGVTRLDDAAWAIQQGATAIGLNFYPKSPRYLPYAQAEEMLRSLSEKKFIAVGVFVRPTAADLQRGLEMGLQMVQLYEADLTVLSDVLPLLVDKVILAQGVKNGADLQRFSEVVAVWQQAGVRPFAVLVDARIEGLHGGTGQTAPWDLIRTWPWTVPLILAGGLTPENVAEAINAVRPWGVDVASGVESAPGVKDGEKVKRFVTAARTSR